MIRSIELICSKCKNNFIPQKDLYYLDDFSAKDMQEMQLICPDCLEEWQNQWQVEKASFCEEDYNDYVTIVLKNGEIYEKIPCTALDGIVATSIELPLAEQKKLYTFYKTWDLKRKNNTLKDCFFTDAFMRTTFTCETYGGECYKDIAFRFNMQGELETEKPLPEYIKEQIILAWKSYQVYNN